MATLLFARGISATERGQGLTEYALVLTFVSIALVGALMVLGGMTNNGLYSNILAQMARLL